MLNIIKHFNVVIPRLLNRHKFLFFMFVGLSLTGCKDKGTNSSELTEFEILDVSIVPDSVVASDTVQFSVHTYDSVETPYHFRWKLQQVEGVFTDTMTTISELLWPAPGDSGVYQHEVWVEKEAGEVFSNEFRFIVTVHLIELPPPKPTEIHNVTVMPDPVTSGDTVQFTATIATEMDERYRFRWQLEQPDGTTKDTLTQTNVLNWPAPQQARKYAHEVQVETKAGELLSTAYPFWNTVVNPADSFYNQAELLFTVNTEGTYLMNTTTGEARHIVNGGGPRWGPDGNRFAYVARSEGWSVFNVYIMNVDGTGKRAVSLMEHNGELEPHLGTSANPAWSPDGKRMAYARCDNCEAGGTNYEVYNVAIDTSSGLDEIRVTDNLYSDYVHDWHPNGETLLIESDERLDGSYNAYGDIYEINPNGSGKSLFDSTDIARPRFSPAGTQVAFTLNGAIFVADSNGSNRKQVIGDDNTTCTVTWAGSEEKLVFIMSETNCGSDKKHIYTINTNGSGLRQLTNELGEYDDVDWRPINN